VSLTINSDTGSIKSSDGGEILVDSGISLCGLNYPTADGTANQVIETDGSGNLTFVTPPAATDSLMYPVDGWDYTVTADTTNGRPKITVTGEAGKTIRWTAFIRTTEVSN